MSEKISNLIGQKFGKWIVISKTKSDKDNKTRLLCRCECGTEREVLGTVLIRGRSKSCGCFRNERVSEATLIDLTNKKFGRLTVLCRAPNRGKQTYWLCKCECGNEKEIQGNSLKDGKVRSCGCYHSECCSNQHKIEYGLASKKQIFNAYKQHAKKRNILFELTFDEFINLCEKNCYYCDSEPSNIQKGNGNGSFKYNGIDRVDNTKGYTLDNVVSCCEICNKAKRDLSCEEFFDWAKRLVSNLKYIGEKHGSVKTRELSEKLPMEA